MKLIRAIIKPHRMEAVKDALKEANVPGMTISEVKGFGRQKGHTEIYRGSEYQVEFLPKLAVEIAVNEETVPVALEAIRKAAHTGEIGDGKIFVVNLEQALRIRTGETGEDAL